MSTAKSANVAVIIAGAGSGTRANLGKNKLLFNIGAMTVLERTILPFLSRKDVELIVITANGNDFETITGITNKIVTDITIKVVLGGDSRTKSVSNAINAIGDDFNGLAAVHDGARPFIDDALLDELFFAAKNFGAVLPVLPIGETVKQVKDKIVISSPDRREFFTAQTPQVFDFQKLKIAYNKITDGDEFTDDAAVYQKFIGDVYTVNGKSTNIKLTEKNDFYRFFPKNFIVGTGYDTHRLTAGRKLVLGGVKIPHTKGLLGHSDADVLTHAVMDALLSAVNIGDIGVLFPDTDPKYKNADSLLLLKHVLLLVKERKFAVNNISASLIAEKPKLAPHIAKIKESLAEAVGICPDMVAISATTNEGLGFVGREEGISCHAVVSLLQCEYV